MNSATASSAIGRNPYVSAVKYVLILAITFAYVYPLFYLVNISLKSPAEYLADPLSLAESFHFANYSDAWVTGNFGRLIFNSLMYVIIPTLASMLLTLLVAFPLSRGYVKKSQLWYSFFLLSLFLPNGLIPQFYLILKLNLYDTVIGYMLLKTSGVGLGLLILVGFIKSIPKELDEAASIDGCGYFRYMLSIIVHLVKPAMVTAAIFQAIGIWNDIIGPTIYLTDPKLYPVVLGLFKFYGSYSNQWTVLAAGIIIVALPLIVLYISLQKYFVDGAVAGAVKT